MERYSFWLEVNRSLTLADLPGVQYGFPVFKLDKTINESNGGLSGFRQSVEQGSDAHSGVVLHRFNVFLSDVSI